MPALQTPGRRQPPLTALDRVSECRLLLNTVLPYSGTSGVVSTYGVCVDENLPMQNVFSGEHFFHEFAANYFSLPAAGGG